MPRFPTAAGNCTNGMSEANTLNAVDDEGFQKVLSLSERRSMKRNKLMAEKKMSVSECSKKETDIISKLKKRGIIVKDEVTEAMVKDSSIEDEELVGYIDELDIAIDAVTLGLVKPDQHLTVAELESRIANIRSNTIKNGKETKRVVGLAMKEADAYISYLQGQITITREFLKVKAVQSSLSKLRNFCREFITFRKKVKDKVERSSHSSAPPAKSAVNEYVLNSINELKAKNDPRHLPLPSSSIVSGQFKVLANDNRFQYPYNYLQRIKNMFTVHVDRNNTVPVTLTVYGIREDVDNCLEYLHKIDFHACTKVAISFSKYKELSSLEDDFNVLTFYYSGQLDIMGPSANVSCTLNYIDEKSQRTYTSINEYNSREKAYECNYLVLRSLSTKFKPLIRDLELEYNVTLRIDANPREEKGKIYCNNCVNSKDDNTDEVLKKIEGLANQFGSLELKGLHTDVIAFLLDPEVQKKRYKSQYTSIIKFNYKVFVVGFKAHLDFGYRRALALIESKDIKPFKLALENNHQSIVIPLISEIENNIGSHIVNSKDALYVYASAKQLEETKKYIDEIILKNDLLERVLTPLEYTLLTDDKSAILHSLENRFGVKCKAVDKKYVNITGEKADVQACNAELDRIFKSVIKLTLEDSYSTIPERNRELREDLASEDGADRRYHTSQPSHPLDMSGHYTPGTIYGLLEVEPSHMSRIIGKSGVNLRSIISKSGVLNISISDNILLIHGNSRCVDDAVDLINQVVTTDGDITEINISHESVYDEYTSKNSFIRKRTGVKKDETKGEENIFNLDTTNQNDFPSLG